MAIAKELRPEKDTDAPLIETLLGAVLVSSNKNKNPVSLFGKMLV